MPVYDDSVKTKRPAVLMMPDWDGVDPKSVDQAKLVAGKRYVVFVADMFGVGYKPKDFNEKREASGGVHSFTDPTAKRGSSVYDEKLARRSYAMMRDFFSESF